MSADDYLVIVKEGRKYVGYHCCASVDDVAVEANPVMFTATSLKRAIELAQDPINQTEYGYEIKGLK